MNTAVSPYGDATRDDSQRRFLAQQSVAMLEQCCNRSKQCRNTVATLSCSKNRRCESFSVTSPLLLAARDVPRREEQGAMAGFTG